MIRRTVLLLAVAATVTCDSGPKVGDLVFDLTTPNQDDGAIQFLVTATEAATLVAVNAACMGCTVYVIPTSETEIRGVLTGSVVPGAALRVTVSDVGNKSLYSAVVVAVANRAFTLRSAVGYTLGTD